MEYGKLWYLRQVDLFEGIEEEEVERLARQAVLRKYARGETILSPGDPSERIYIIKRGRVKLSKYSPEGKEQILALLQSGDVFGALALVGGQENVHVEAFEETVVCSLRLEDFFAIVRAHPEIVLRLLKLLARRLEIAEREVEELVFQDVPGRLASLLLRLAREYGEPAPGGVRISLRLTHQDLANMIGATRETVTSVLGRFRTQGLLAFDRRRIVVLNPEGLATLAGAGRVHVRDGVLSH